MYHAFNWLHNNKYNRIAKSNNSQVLIFFFFFTKKHLYEVFKNMRFYVFFQNNLFVGKHINSKTSLLRLETSVCVLFTIIEKHPTQGSLLWCVILKNESYDYEDNFQNDSSSYVLFCRYIYSDKSGRLALKLNIEHLLFLCW